MTRAASAIVALALAVASSCSGAAAPTSAPSPSPSVAPTPAIAPPAIATPPASSAPADPAPSASATPAVVVDPVQAPWTEAIDRIVAGQPVSVAVGVGNRIVYVHRGSHPRIPASGQKLLTSMAALELFGRGHRFPTVAASERRPRAGVVRGDLWLVGGGDPELGAARLGRLAASLRSSGVRRVAGSVIGDTSAFSRRWWAPGWVEGISRSYVRRPTALVFEGNLATAPELAAATSLTASLRAAGIWVDGDPRSGIAPAHLREVASIRSAPLWDLLTRQNHGSLNLHAEVLLRAIGAAHGTVGTTAAGAELVETWAEGAGVGADVRVRDGSGLSHGDAVSATDLATLLLTATGEPWGTTLEASLPAPGQGTLRGRLAGAPIRAKTGTLFTVPCSALAGYGRDAEGRPFAFAVLSEGVAKGTSLVVEDAVIRALIGARLA